jgi:hypothetical protein
VSRKETSNTQRHAGRADQPGKQRRKPDVRAQRTRERLGSAFVALIHEKPIEEVTVQDVLDRTSIAARRSTFITATRTTCSSASWKRSWRR